MMVVNFIGELGRMYGERITLQADTPAEALGLLKANHPALPRDMVRLGYSIVAYEPESADPAMVLDKETLRMQLSDREQLFLVPHVGGSLDPGTWYLIYLAVTVAFTVLAIMMAPDAPDHEDSGGYLFDGSSNTVRQGNPVALCYGGPIRVGSQVISVSLSSEDIPT